MRNLSWIFVLVSPFIGLLGEDRVHAQETAKPPGEKPTITSLIDQLPNIAAGDIGYMASMSGGGFLPVGEMKPGAMLLGQKRPNSSPVMRELVARGAESLPELIAHLDDSRKTKIAIDRTNTFANVFFDDEYEYNRRTAKSPPADVNRRYNEEKHLREHTITVGDLCFVAIGQIVNRRFSAVRYQPTAIVIISSPTYSERLRKAIKAEWGGLTKEQHKASLIRDFKEPDHEYRRMWAAIRLAYYYPKDFEPLAIEQLSQPLVDNDDVETFLRAKLYRAKKADERQSLLNEFIAKRNPAYRDAVVAYLFREFDSNDNDPDWPDRSPQSPRVKARECLEEVFGYPKNVERSAQPLVVVNDWYVQARFIEAIAPFATPKVDAEVRKILHSTESARLAQDCIRFLAGRGSDDDIRMYVARREALADLDQKKLLERLKQMLGWTALHVAAAEFNIARLEELAKQGADVNAPANDGRTPLHIAAENGNIPAIQILLQHGANRDAKDAKGKTPLEKAREGGKLEAARLLEK